MTVALKYDARFAQHMALRLEVVVQHFEDGLRIMSYGDISAGKAKVERTLKDLRTLVNNTFPFGETRR